MIDPAKIPPIVSELDGLLRDPDLLPGHRVQVLRLADHLFGSGERLIVYGSLVPGGSNHHLVEPLGGAWTAGAVTGDLHESGWGAALGYPALLWRSEGPRVAAWMLTSPALPSEWEALDRFEGEAYRRILAPFLGASGEILAVGCLYEAATPPPVGLEEAWSEAPVFGAPPQDGRCTVRPGAYALVADGSGRLALVRTPQGIFLPGGGIESGETAEEAVTREVREECGLEVRPGAWRARAVQFAWGATGKTYFEKRSTFIEASSTGAPGRGAEADHELLWVEPEAAAGILTHPSQAWAVGQWKQRAGRP